MRTPTTIPETATVTLAMLAQLTKLYFAVTLAEAAVTA
jgi:hypothetical protein